MYNVLLEDEDGRTDVLAECETKEEAEAFVTRTHLRYQARIVEADDSDED